MAMATTGHRHHGDKKKRLAVAVVSHRTSLLAGGKQRKTRNGNKEQFTILSSSQRKKSFLKVLVSNRNPVEDLYKLFPQLPPGEKPLNGFSCALYKDILLQGKITICSTCVCFHSNIFGYETRVIIHFKNIIAIKRERTAFVVPNAISIQTVKKRYLFCSFLSRESSFKLLSRIWTQAFNMDENENSPTEAIKINDTRPPKGSSNELMNFSSSSFSSSFPRSSSVMERPYSSPPSLGGGCTRGLLSSLGGSPLKTPISDLEGADCVFTVNGSGGSNRSGSSTESFDDDTMIGIIGESTTAIHIRRVKSTGNLSDVAALGHKFCYKNLEMIRDKEAKRVKDAKITKPKKENGSKCEKVFCTLSNECRHYGSSILTRLRQMTSFMNSLRTQHPFLLAISIFVLLLSLFTFNLLVRINGIAHMKKENHKFTDHTRLKNLFEFKEGMHMANVERLRSILSVNLETVSEVQKTLSKLREKLKSNE